MLQRYCIVFDYSLQNFLRKRIILNLIKIKSNQIKSDKIFENKFLLKTII